MAIKVSKLVWEHYELAGGALIVLLWMADHCDDPGAHLFPSMRTLAHDCCMPEKQVRRHVHSLIHDGYLGIVGNEAGGAPGTTRQYDLRLERLKRDAPASPPSTPPQSIRRTHGR
ncbi:UNVERIFIED_ORG: hypothetical protein ABIC62_002437 [Burkholderia sp. 1595]|uniref:Helix-turn-helix domain-containing protein n=1 Tax=Paraburkholderia terricola TaxID=169427 RepID=A0ABU1LT67_9BURK|nr:helix-turn-helix domain-containing protein [Paraburkholderia terricola]MDR6409736.1 hypothetical protein [Paraburkholderia terricola]